jgi:hypothetical protein
MLTIEKIREAKRELEKHRLLPNPDGTYTLPKRVWEKMLEMAEELSVPTRKPRVNSATNATGSSGIR